MSEPVKPAFPCVVMSNTIHAYISQSDKGELVIGAGTDAYTSYSQRGALHITEHTLDAICELFPMFRRMRMLRNWGGIVDVTPDRSPILSKTDVKGLYVNCGWGTGGFKATPGSGHVFAHTIARDEPHRINAPSPSTASATATSSTRPPPPPWHTEGGGDDRTESTSDIPPLREGRRCGASTGRGRLCGSHRSVLGEDDHWNQNPFPFNGKRRPLPDASRQPSPEGRDPGAFGSMRATAFPC